MLRRTPYPCVLSTASYQKLPYQLPYLLYNIYHFQVNNCYEPEERMTIIHIDTNHNIVQQFKAPFYRP